VKKPSMRIHVFLLEINPLKSSYFVKALSFTLSCSLPLSSFFPSPSLSLPLSRFLLHFLSPSLFLQKYGKRIYKLNYFWDTTTGFKSLKKGCQSEVKLAFSERWEYHLRTEAVIYHCSLTQKR